MPTDLSEFLAQSDAVLEALTAGWEGPLRPASEEILTQYALVQQIRFDEEGYGEWPPLTPGTLRRKAEAGYPPWILVATGFLRGSLQIGGPENIFQIGQFEMYYGTEVVYAEKHQYGDYPTPIRTILIDADDAMEEWAAQLLGNRLAEIASSI